MVERRVEISLSKKVHPPPEYVTIFSVLLFVFCPRALFIPAAKASLVVQVPIYQPQQMCLKGPASGSISADHFSHSAGLTQQCKYIIHFPPSVSLKKDIGKGNHKNIKAIRDQNGNVRRTKQHINIAVFFLCLFVFCIFLFCCCCC